MARLRLAPYLMGISGRMAGVVYRVTKFGTDMAEFNAPSNPRTAPQTAVRSAFTKATKQWRTLTRAQSDAWRKYAKGLFRYEPIGEQYNRPNGFNAFVALAAKFFAVNPGSTSAPASPPTAPFDGDTITVTVAPGPGGNLVYTASGANATNVTTALLFQPLPNGNASPIPGAYRIAKFNAFAAGSLSTQVPVGPGFFAVGYQFTSSTTGQVAEPVFLPAIVGPVSFALREGGKKAA